ncbi:MAG: TonB-dependent receptor [Acidobacteria bacterium]|nr:TonB-dependent receptor [Acidobacteriota bacterium]
MTQPRVRARVTRLALIGWAVAVTASAQGLGTLTGTVTTPAGIPVEGLRLTFTRTDTVVTAVTDGAGDYRLEGLEPGLYDPTIDDPEQAVEPSFPVTVVADITIRRDFTLRSAADVQVRLRGGDRLLGAGPGLTTTVENLDAFEARDHSLATFLRRAPGVSVSRAGGVGQPTAVRWRGAPVTDRFLLTDGLPLPGFGAELDASSHLEWARFEAVRGTTSTLHGGLGGGVQRRTKIAGDPRARGVSVGVETGDLGWRQYEAATTGSRGDYDWSIAGQRLETANEQPNSDFMRTGVAGTLGLARESLSVDFTFRGEMAAVGRSGPTSLLRADMDASEERTRLMSGVTLGLRRGNSLHEGRLVVSRTERRTLNPLDSLAVSLFPVDRVGLQLELPDFVLADGLRDDLQTAQLTYEWSFRADEFHTMVFGGGAEVQAGRFGDPLAAPVADPVADAMADPVSGPAGFDQQRLNLVAYGEDRMQVFDNLTVTAGGRFERYGPYPIAVVPRGSARYDLGPGVFVHGSAGTSAAAPTLAQRFRDTLWFRGNPELQLARSRAFDGGLTAALWGGGAEVDLTGFRNAYQDLVVWGGVDIPALDSLPEYRRLRLSARRQLVEDVRAGLRDPLVATATFDQARTSYVNLPSSRTQGVEASFTATPGSGLELAAAYTFTDSLVTRGTGRIATGDWLPGVPRHKAAFTAALDVGPVSAGGTMTWVGERQTDADFFSEVFGLDALAAYRRWDAYAQVRLGDRISVSVVGENLTDERYEDWAGFPALGRFVRAGVQVGF